MTQDFTLPATEEEYLASSSKYPTFPPGAKVGDTLARTVEVIGFDWDTPGNSIKIEVQITEEGADKSKQDKISFGIEAKKKDGSPGGLWKGRELYKNTTGEEMPMVEDPDGTNHPKPDPMAVIGKTAEGVWIMQEGKKGGVGEPVIYPKLMNLLPAGSKPEGLGL